MFRTSLIVMSVIVAIAFCLPGAAEARGDHNWKKHRYDGKKYRDDDDDRKRHRYVGRPFRALLNHINELEAKMEALSLEMSSTSSTSTTPSVGAPQVSFLATMIGDMAAINNGKVVFDLVVHDHEMNYNNLNGAFTAPGPGVYQFDTTVFYDLSMPGETALLRIMINGGAFDLSRKPVVRVPGQTSDSISGQITVHLNPGDVVQIVYAGPTIRRSSFGNALGGTRFSGHQLYSSDGP